MPLAGMGAFYVATTGASDGALNLAWTQDYGGGGGNRSVDTLGRSRLDVRIPAILSHSAMLPPVFMLRYVREPLHAELGRMVLMQDPYRSSSTSDPSENPAD